jgi:antitoxin ParD1/3/4
MEAQMTREDALKLKALPLHIKAGIEAIERGQFVEVEEADLDGYLQQLAAESDKSA